MNFSKMTNLLTNDEFEISKDPKNDTSFYIRLRKPNSSLLTSLTRTYIILGATIIDNYQTLHFKASSFESYEEHKNTLYKLNGSKSFPYTISLKMTYYMAKQLNYLITEEEKCFYEFNPKYIMVIDGSKFIYLSNSHLLELEENHIQIMRPFVLNNTEGNIDFVSPEFLEIKELPYKLHYKTIFYSLGYLLIYSLTNELITNTTNIEEIEKLLKPIKETKLYWLIKRCLEREAEKRILLLV